MYKSMSLIGIDRRRKASESCFEASYARRRDSDKKATGAWFMDPREHIFRSYALEVEDISFSIGQRVGLDPFSLSLGGSGRVGGSYAFPNVFIKIMRAWQEEHA